MGEPVLKCDCGYCKICRARERMRYSRGRQRNFEPSKRSQILEQAAVKQARKEALVALLRGDPVAMPQPPPRRRRPNEVLQEIRTTLDKLTGLIAELSV